MEIKLKHREYITDVTAYLFLALFIYTATSKLMGVNAFSSVLAKSPIIGSYHLTVAWAIPVVEIAISVLLILSATRKQGLYASFLLMIIFTLYLAYIVYSGNKLPCHCGGVISSMTWKQHIWFNLCFIAIGLLGISIHRK